MSTVSEKPQPVNLTAAFEELFELSIEQAQDDAAGHGFVMGFIAGQCEKVYNGVCQAAMFRGTKMSPDLLSELVVHAANRYGLAVTTNMLATESEFWVYRKNDPNARLNLDIMCTAPDNTPVWHKTRAELCGIPKHLIDEKYHERRDQT